MQHKQAEPVSALSALHPRLTPRERALAGEGKSSGGSNDRPGAIRSAPSHHLIPHLKELEGQDLT